MELALGDVGWNGRASFGYLLGSGLFLIAVACFWRGEDPLVFGQCPAKFLANRKRLVAVSSRMMTRENVWKARRALVMMPSIQRTKRMLNQAGGWRVEG